MGGLWQVSMHSILLHNRFDPVDFVMADKPSGICLHNHNVLLMATIQVRTPLPLPLAVPSLPSPAALPSPPFSFPPSRYALNNHNLLRNASWLFWVACPAGLRVALLCGMPSTRGLHHSTCRWKALQACLSEGGITGRVCRRGSNPQSWSSDNRVYMEEPVGNTGGISKGHEASTVGEDISAELLGAGRSKHD